MKNIHVQSTELISNDKVHDNLELAKNLREVIAGFPKLATIMEPIQNKELANAFEHIEIKDLDEALYDLFEVENEESLPGQYLGIESSSILDYLYDNHGSFKESVKTLEYVPFPKKGVKSNSLEYFLYINHKYRSKSTSCLNYLYASDLITLSKVNFFINEIIKGYALQIKRRLNELNLSPYKGRFYVIKQNGYGFFEKREKENIQFLIDYFMLLPDPCDINNFIEHLKEEIRILLEKDEEEEEEIEGRLKIIGKVMHTAIIRIIQEGDFPLAKRLIKALHDEVNTCRNKKPKNESDLYFRKQKKSADDLLIHLLTRYVVGNIHHYQLPVLSVIKAWLEKKNDSSYWKKIKNWEDVEGAIEKQGKLKETIESCQTSPPIPGAYRLFLMGITSDHPLSSKTFRGALVNDRRGQLCFLNYLKHKG